MLVNHMSLIGDIVKIAGVNPNHLSVSGVKGSFGESFLHPVTHVQVNFQGVLPRLEGTYPGFAGGWFRSGSQSGYVFIGPEGSPYLDTHK